MPHAVVDQDLGKSQLYLVRPFQADHQVEGAVQGQRPIQAGNQDLGGVDCEIMQRVCVFPDALDVSSSAIA